MQRILHSTRICALLAVLAPSIGHAQIYPLEVYASAVRAGTKQPLKFMHSPANGTYVGLCNTQGDGSTLCDLAKDGAYSTETGTSFSTRHMGQLYSADGHKRCTYTAAATLACD